MNEDLMVFIVMVTLISGGIFLLFIKLILSFFRDRRGAKGATLGASELEEMIERAVEAGTASLHDRLDDLEARLDKDKAPAALPPAARGYERIEVETPAEVVTPRRPG